MSIKGMSIIVTGAAQGIGAAMARGFAERGARVALADISDPSAVVDSIRLAGGDAIGMRTDVTQLPDCEAMVTQTATAFGRLDGLVCNAALFAALSISS